MISLDVKSLFNNLPRELIFKSLNKRWELIAPNTNLDVGEFIKGIEIILNNTYFSFDGKFYSQIEGSPMGSPISPILADIVMEDLEVFYLQKLNSIYDIYIRYVDDIFMTVSASEVEHVLEVFNSYHDKLKFTVEKEVNGQLNFLDVSVIRDKGESIITNWYRKPTFSGRYLNYHSEHPNEHKISVVTSLVDRAILLSDDRFHNSNLTLIEKILINNNYPIQFIKKHVKKRCNILRMRINNVDDNRTPSRDGDKSINIVLPYIKKFSEKLNSKMKKTNIKIVNRGYNTLANSIIKTGKDKLANNKQSSLIYKIECKNCDKVYIGQTHRYLEKRIKEHKSNINSENPSVINEHVKTNNHFMNWDEVKILDKEKHYYKRLTSEMIYIEKYGKDSLNKFIDLKE